MYTLPSNLLIGFSVRLFVPEVNTTTLASGSTLVLKRELYQTIKTEKESRGWRNVTREREREKELKKKDKEEDK